MGTGPVAGERREKRPTPREDWPLTNPFKSTIYASSRADLISFGVSDTLIAS